MKLLVVSHSCSAPVNQQLYAEVRKTTGWEISIVLPANWRDEYGRECLAERWPAFDGRLIPVPVRRSGHIVLHTYRTSFAKLIRDTDPDVVYVNHEPYAAATAQVYLGNLCAGGRPVRRPIGFYSCQNIFKSYPPPFRWTESWVLRSSAFFFPISSAVNDLFRRKGYRGDSTVLPLAIDPDVYHPQPDAVSRRDLLGEAAQVDAVLLGYVGRLVPEKGLATLIAAAGRLRDLPWRLVLVGTGPMRDELERLATTAGVADRVSFTGFIPHLQTPRVLSALDVLVLPSETQANWREQFGRVVLEAMACGTAVVGSDSGEIPTLLRDTGGGLTFREGDATDLANTLRRLAVDAGLRDQLANQGRAAVANHYTIADAARLFADTVQSIATPLPPTRFTLAGGPAATGGPAAR